MDTRRLLRLWNDAHRYMKKERAGELRWARSISRNTWHNIGSSTFLREYAWVVYAAGIRNDILDQYWPRLRRAFGGFRLTRVAKMRSTTRVIAVFRNEQKASHVLQGSAMIQAEGFRAFKARVARNWEQELEGLPGIGPITKFHLARNVGLADTGKPDLWVSRITKLAYASDWQAMLQYLSKRSHLPPRAVDVVLFRYGADRAWRDGGHRTFQDYFRHL
jgi:hypothetical protein